VPIAHSGAATHHPVKKLLRYLEEGTTQESAGGLAGIGQRTRLQAAVPVSHMEQGTAVLLAATPTPIPRNMLHPVIMSERAGLSP
jgi:hypothetical protein